MILRKNTVLQDNLQSARVGRSPLRSDDRPLATDFRSSSTADMSRAGSYVRLLSTTEVGIRSIWVRFDINFGNSGSRSDLNCASTEETRD
jgi:hypothetical protein